MGDIVAEVNKPTFIDLFCGCGGFSLGLRRAGFHALASIDFNEEAIKVYRANFRKKSNILKKDLTEYTPDKLAQDLDIHNVDVIIGGPPCQGFSTVRRKGGANHGSKIIADNRRHLYKKLLDYVGYFKPKIFVMENVLGIRTAASGEYYKSVQYDARKLGYRVYGIILNASDYGVPQKRRRQLIIGTRLDLPIYFNETGYLDKYKLDTTIKLWEVIGDLPRLKAGEGIEERDYDLDRRFRHLCKVSENGRWYFYKILKPDKSKKLISHVARSHSQRDLDDFEILHEGENSSQAIRRGAILKCPYKMSCFKDKYTRQDSNGLCSTIVAHMSKDGLMFIHPDQIRSLTVREAARIQSFPDTYIFPVPRTHQFRLIGNAVPPLVGDVLGRSMKKYLKDIESFSKKCSDDKLLHMPKDPIEAADRLLELVRASKDGSIKSISCKPFKKGWYAVGFLYPGIHPDSVVEDGRVSQELYDDDSYIDDELKQCYPELISEYYKQNGCPLILEPVIREAYRRYKLGELKYTEYYCSYALYAGIHNRFNVNNIKPEHLANGIKVTAKCGDDV